MYDIETITQVFEDIRAHPSPLSARQAVFVDKCEDEFEADRELTSNRIARLYEILDELDERAGLARADESDSAESWGDETDYDFVDDEGWDEREFWN